MHYVGLKIMLKYTVKVWYSQARNTTHTFGYEYIGSDTAVLCYPMEFFL